MFKSLRFSPFAAAAASILVLASCEGNGEGTKTEDPTLGNEFLFGGEIRKIKSVVYSPEEDERFTKFGSPAKFRV